MICPFKLIADCIEDISNAGSVDVNCSRAECALWNDRFGMCALAVDAFLKGQADYRSEREQERKARHDY